MGAGEQSASLVVILTTSYGATNGFLIPPITVIRLLMRDIRNLPTPPQADDLTIPLRERKTIASLGTLDCRWPFGDPLDPDFHFCGKATADGSTYCEFHMRRAFQPARPRAVFYRPNAA